MDLKNFKIGQPIYSKRRSEFCYFIAYWPEIGRIIYAYRLFSMIRYEHVSIKTFEDEFLFEKEDVRAFIENKIKEEKEEQLIKVPDKLYKKLENQKWQLNCMKKLNKPLEDIKKGERNIKRQTNKILRYDERNEEMEAEIDFEYSVVWDSFEQHFGE